MARSTFLLAWPKHLCELTKLTQVLAGFLLLWMGFSGPAICLGTVDNPGEFQQRLMSSSPWRTTVSNVGFQRMLAWVPSFQDFLTVTFILGSAHEFSVVTGASPTQMILQTDSRHFKVTALTGDTRQTFLFIPTLSSGSSNSR